MVAVEADFTQGPPNTPGINRVSLNNPANRNFVRAIDIQRGRQFELDQVQAGTCTLDITDPLENLNPQNTASPFMTSGNTLKPYRCIRVGASWNPNTNLAPNGTFNNGTTGWGAYSASTLSAVTDTVIGATAARATSTTTSTGTGITASAAIPITTGYQFIYSATVNVSQTGVVGLWVDWSNSLGVYMSTTAGPSGTVTAGQSTLLSTTTMAAPVGAAFATIYMYGTVAVGQWVDVTNVVFASPVGSTAGNMLTTVNQIPGQPSLSVAYGYDPSFENWYLARSTTSGATLSSPTTPADSTFPVLGVTVAAVTDTVSYTLRTVPAGTYTITADVYAPSGTTVQMAYGATNASTTTTGSYQNLSIIVTAAAATVLAFTATAATAYPTTFYVANVRVTGVIAGWSQTAGSAMRYTLSQAHSGSYSNGSIMNAVTDTMSLPTSTVPGITYTMSAWCYALSTGTVATMTVAGANASTTLVNTWQRLVVTFTATQAVTTVSWAASAGSYPVSIYVDDIQLEIAAAASTYSPAGPQYYPLYTGYIERFPLQYDMNGTRGIRPLTCVDALSVLSRTEISQAYSTTILADAPNVYIPFNDASIPQVVQLPTGGQPFIGYENLGTSGSVNFAGDSFLDGTSAVSLTQQNTNPVILGNTAYITYLGTYSGQLTMNPQSFSLEMWFKWSSGVVYFGVGAVPITENPNTEATGPVHYFGAYTTGGALAQNYKDPNGTGGVQFTIAGGGETTFSGYPDSTWHHLVIMLTGSNSIASFIDGVGGSPASMSITASTAVLLNNFFVDATTIFGDPVSTIAVANWAAYPFVLSQAQITAHYQRGIGYQGEVSGTRVSRLLTKYWGGPMNIAAGKRQLAPDYTYDTRFMLDVLQEIQETERGLIYADRAGTVVFEDSGSRYSNQTALWIFGENPTGAASNEYPYSEYKGDYDPTYTFSQTNLSRPGNSTFPPQINSQAATDYGQRILTQTVQVNTDFDLMQASTFYLARYALPKVRIETLTLNPAGNSALWSVILGLEISQRDTVKRRAGGLTTSNDYYIEQINHKINADSGEWTVDLQCSPVFVPTAWVLGDPVYGVLGSTTVPIY
ncbi:MAG: hypothetical protein ACREQ5_02180 [Candidatus Dormibacteria bacterium]